MIGVDTNVLIRLLTADEPVHHRASAEFFGERSVDSPAFVSAVTMAEMLWVLREAYDYSYADVLLVVSSILDTDDFVVEGRAALEAMRDLGKPALMNDFLIAYLGERAGCTKTVTIDRSAARSISSMELLA